MQNPARLWVPIIIAVAFVASGLVPKLWALHYSREPISYFVDRMKSFDKQLIDRKPE